MSANRADDQRRTEHERAGHRRERTLGFIREDEPQQHSGGDAYCKWQQGRKGQAPVIFNFVSVEAHSYARKQDVLTSIGGMHGLEADASIFFFFGSFDDRQHAQQETRGRKLLNKVFHKGHAGHTLE
jgi:hypothetical protein